MFDHVKFGVTDYAASKAFYLKALEPLGIAIIAEGTTPAQGAELSPKGKASLCLYQTEEKPAHLHLAFTAENRQQVEAFSTYTDPDRREYHSWWFGPINILMAEYVLVTGDRTFMPALERITMEIVHGQSPVGSWGHRFIQDSGRLAGYGMMNAPGLPLALSLVLAREAGVENPELDLAIEKSSRLIRFYVGKGSVPYGDHNPWIETGHALPSRMYTLEKTRPPAV